MVICLHELLLPNLRMHRDLPPHFVTLAFRAPRTRRVRPCFRLRHRALKSIPCGSPACGSRKPLTTKAFRAAPLSASVTRRGFRGCALRRCCVRACVSASRSRVGGGGKALLVSVLCSRLRSVPARPTQCSFGLAGLAAQRYVGRQDPAMYAIDPKPSLGRTGSRRSGRPDFVGISIRLE